MTDLERVWVTVVVILRETDVVYVTEGIIESVRVGDIVYVTEGVIERVKGKVVGIPLTETVPQGDGEPVRVREVVAQPLKDLVKGCVLGIAVIERVGVGDMVYVTEAVIERVKGKVVGIPLTETVPQGEGEPVRVREVVAQPLTDLVKGCVLGIAVIERVCVREIVYVTEGVIESVNCWVVAMPLTETVPQGDGERLRVREVVAQPLIEMVNG